MFKFLRKTLTLVLVATFLTISFGSPALAQQYFEAEDPGGGAMIFDLCLVRPVGIMAMAVGAATFVLTLPFSALGDNVDVASQKLLKEPAAYTFKRPIGEFRQFER